MYPISSCSSRGLFIFLPGKGEGQRGEGTLRSFCKNLPPKNKKQKKNKNCTISLNLILILITFITIPMGRRHSDFYVRPATLKSNLSEWIIGWKIMPPFWVSTCEKHPFWHQFKSTLSLRFPDPRESRTIPPPRILINVSYWSRLDSCCCVGALRSFDTFRSFRARSVSLFTLFLGKPPSRQLPVSYC